MGKGVFITGTDTDVGKTIVTAGLLRHFRNLGRDAVSMKPIQTGATLVDGVLRAPDLDFHRNAAGLDIQSADLDLLAPYLYEPACSPHLAGRLAKRYPGIEEISQRAQRLLESHQVVLIEGAGGIHAPVHETATMCDMMKALALPVILVAHRGLGTINHSLLSLHALKGAGLKVLGIVFNETQDQEEDFIRKDNPAAVGRLGKVEVLGNIDYLGKLESGKKGTVPSESSSAWTVPFLPDTAWQKFERCMPGLKTLEKLLK